MHARFNALRHLTARLLCALFVFGLHPLIGAGDCCAGAGGHMSTSCARPCCAAAQAVPSCCARPFAVKQEPEFSAGRPACGCKLAPGDPLGAGVPTCDFESGVAGKHQSVQDAFVAAARVSDRTLHACMSFGSPFAVQRTRPPDRDAAPGSSVFARIRLLSRGAPGMLSVLCIARL